MVVKDEYEVNVGNIGNIQCETAAEALDTYHDYVKMSKQGHGRGAQENVCILVNGEPDQGKDFNWYDWRIQQQKEVITNFQNEISKATKILQSLITRQQEEYGI